MNEAQTLLDWMREQMYGDTVTEWTYGNEHDRMSEAADLLSGLLSREYGMEVQQTGQSPVSVTARQTGIVTFALTSRSRLMHNMYLHFLSEHDSRILINAD